MIGAGDYLVVASHGRYGEARQRLLASLATWPRDRLVVVLNGEPADGVDRHPDGSHTVRFASNLYEYSAFFVPHALGAPPGAAFLLVHDTSVAGADFVPRARQAFARFREESCDVLWCSRTGQCNVCVFGGAAAARARELWGGLTTLDKRRAIRWEHDPEDLSLKAQDDLAQTYLHDGSYVAGVEVPYSSGLPRHALYFPALDLTKFYFNMDSHEGPHPDAP